MLLLFLFIIHLKTTFGFIMNAKLSPTNSLRYLQMPCKGVAEIMADASVANCLCLHFTGSDLGQQAGGGSQRARKDKYRHGKNLHI